MTARRDDGVEVLSGGGMLALRAFAGVVTACVGLAMVVFGVQSSDVLAAALVLLGGSLFAGWVLASSEDAFGLAPLRVLLDDGQPLVLWGTSVS